MKHLLILGIAFAALHVSHSNPPAFCQLPDDEGQGMHFTFALYYNATQDQCNPFIYKGEGGNANRFQNERECIRNCSINAEDKYPMDVTQACHFKKMRGACGGEYLRYYYDSINGKCKKFFWSGCYGNGNRFTTFESCNATCSGIRDEGEEPEEEEPDTPIAIIVGVVLGIVTVALIITVIVLAVKTQQNKSKKKGKGKNKDTNAPLQEQRIEMS